MKYSVHIGAFFLLAGLVCVSVIKHIYLPFTPDNAVHLFAARTILENGSLYPFFFETNPPLFPYLTVLPVVIADALGSSAIVIYRVVTYLGSALALFLAMREIRGFKFAAGHVQLLIIVLFWATLLIGLQGFGFGQRDHLVGVFFFPYVAGLAVRLHAPRLTATGARALSIPAAVLAAVAIAIKPHFIFIWIFGELAAMVRTRHWRSLFSLGNILIAGLGAAYIGAALVLEPYYFSDILPMLRQTYGAIGHDMSSFAILFWIATTVFQVVALFIHARASSGAFWSERVSMAAAFLVASQGAFLGYALQAHFPYQMWPYYMLSGASLVLFLLPGEDQAALDMSSHRQMAGAAAICFFLAIVATPAWIWQEAAKSRGQNIDYDALWSEHNPHLQTQIDAINGHTETGTYYIFTTNVSSVFPATLYTSANWKFRYPTLWPLPAIANAQRLSAGHVPEGLRHAEATLMSQMVEDFRAYRPDLVLVDISPQKSFFSEDQDGLKAIDYLAWFNRSSDFRDVFSQYIPCGSFITFAKQEFAIYLKRSGPAQTRQDCLLREAGEK
jgi:hypothetical protein